MTDAPGHELREQFVGEIAGAYGLHASLFTSNLPIAGLREVRRLFIKQTAQPIARMMAVEISTKTNLDVTIKWPPSASDAPACAYKALRENEIPTERALELSGLSQ